MLARILIILCLLLSSYLQAEGVYENNIVHNETTFNTIFLNIEKGKYKGTINGLLLVKKNNKDTILDFQGSEAILELIPDNEAVYDISFKKYIGFTTSGKTKMLYTTYGYANELSIILDNKDYRVGVIDGACDSIIKNLSFHYAQDVGAEYLILTVISPIELDDFYSEMEAGNISGVDDTNYKKQSIQLMPQSVIIFAITKKPFK